MPVHNWEGIEDGVFHDLHGAWIQQLRKALNSGLLPDNYVAKSEQYAGGIIADPLTLQVDDFPDTSTGSGDSDGGLAVMAPPKTAMKKSFSVLAYVDRQNSIVIRHTVSGRIAAVFEIVSRGNKSGSANFETFMAKIRACLRQGIHFSYVDVHPPGNLDPLGIHGRFCRDNGEEPPQLLSGKVLTAAAYEAGSVVNAYWNSFGVGDAIPDTPLFLQHDFYVMLPLEKTYGEAFSYFGKHDQASIERNKN